jgi:hypothetical protein
MSNNILVGKTIKKIFLADDRKAIKFVLDNNDSIIARCDGDCCSHTWIEDLINPENAIDSEVLSADDIDLPEEFQNKTKTDNYEEEMLYYGFAIVTNKGKFTIAYRNSSNGYYGGNLSWPDNEYYYGGVHGQNISKENWVEVIE